MRIKNSNITIPDKPSFSGLDDDMMRKMYNRLKYCFRLHIGWSYQKQPKTYEDLVIVGSVYKSDNELKKERQAVLALESIGMIKKVGNELWQTIDYDESVVGQAVESESKEYDYNG